MKLFNSNQLLEHALDVRLHKQQRLSANVANVDTPGYAPKTVDFETSMENFVNTQSDARLAQTSSAHMSVNGMSLRQGSDDAIEIVADKEGVPTLDDNSVDLDHTMSQLAENGVQFQTVAKTLQKKLGLLRYVAADGAA